MITGANETQFRLYVDYYLDKKILIRLCVEALGVKHVGNNCGEGMKMENEGMNLAAVPSCD